MGSLWRQMVSRWLGGVGSEGSNGDSLPRDALLPEPTVPGFRVTRDPRARPAAPAAPHAPGAAGGEEIEHEDSHRG